MTKTSIHHYEYFYDCLQYVPKVMVGFHAPTLYGPDIPRFLFLGACEANHLQCSYSQHSAPETANQGSCCICHC
jgi:hypothetical protein